MKKKAFAFLFLLISLTNPAKAEEINDWYLGTKMGWSHFNLLKYYLNYSKSLNSTSSKENLSQPILGIFLGHEFNPYISVELEHETNGIYPYLILQPNKNQNLFNSLQIAAKFSYPITHDFNVYGKFGSMMLWDDIASKQKLKNILTEDSAVIPNFSVGAEYVSNNQFFTRLDYTWQSNFKNIINHTMQLSDGDIALSFGWKFGNTNDIFTNTDNSEFSNQQYTELNENVNFPSNSAQLKPMAYEKLDKLENNIKNLNTKDISILLSGYSDRLGNEQNNQKLSEDRAYAVQEYFISKGFPKSNIVVQGMGELNSLTDQVCKNIKNKPLLISCLAPDRRVEIEVLSAQ